ncbi:kinetochore-associated protein 1-like [Acanthaster planci]|uniref:Kinetochore-associated protein 1-like n=1 Tax=Acanthaster planci TaxID=133434 RepID=A0A8B7YVK2_ACAPL|nr:kinetochore-associated protein 1-like [Acanthaster planci]
MSWDDVEAGIGGDETANFGPRQESGSSLFQVDTLATISPRGEVECNPHVYAACAPEGFCVVAGSQVSLFDEACQKFISTLSFESDVDVVTWSKDSLFLVVAECSGSIHFVDVELKQVLFSQVLKSGSETVDKKCFLQMMFSPGKDAAVHDLLILRADGQLFRFSNINLEKLNEAIEARDLQLAKELQASICMESLDTGLAHSGSVSFFTTATSMGKTIIITCGYGEAVVGLWSRRNKAVDLIQQIGSDFFDGGGVEKCRVSGNGKYLFLLDDSHTLSAWDLRSLLMISFWPDLAVQDFLLMNFNSVNTGEKGSNTNAEQAQLQLVLLTRPEPDCYLKVFTLPGLQCTYTLTVSGYTTLAEVLPNQETIFLIEGAYDSDEDHQVPTDLISTLRVRCLTEALPETRFHRLLHKQKFEEALQFARLFKLDEELVFKVKASVLLEMASPWNQSLRLDPDEGSALSSQLMECLDHIPDEAFMVEKCTQATLPTYESMFQLIGYAHARLSKKLVTGLPVENNQLPSSSLMTRVLEVLHRLATFQMVFGYQQFSANQWDRFLHADLLEELLHWLSMAHIAKAVIIWQRHKAVIESSLLSGGIETLESILSSIPESTPSTQITPWLREDLIPFVIHRFPQGKKFLACWMEERARNMEISEKALWPSNSLEFAELFFTASKHRSSSASNRHLATPAQFATEVCNLSAGNSRKLTNEDHVEKEVVVVQSGQVINTENDCTEAVCRLQELIKNLKELLRLHSRYQCKLSLAEYTQETASTLVFRMLDRVAAPELIQSTIEKLIRPYVQEHNLNEDKLLLQYIQDLLSCYAQGRRATYVYEAFWEAKAIAIIHCIKDVECKCLGIYSLMLSASMPWNDKMEQLVRQGLSLKHPKVEELRGKYKLVQLKKMLANYDLRHDDVRKDNAAMVIKYILASDKADCLEDALQVTKAYNHLSPTDVYIFRLKSLIQHDRIQDGIELLSSLNLPEAVECAKRVVTWAEVILNEPPCFNLDSEDKKELIFITQGAVSILKFLRAKTTHSSDLKDLEDLQKDLKCVLSLQIDFNEFLSLSEFRDASVRKVLLTKHLAAFYRNKSGSSLDTKKETKQEGEKKKATSERNFSRIYNLGRLLGMSHEKLKSQLAMKAAEMGQIKTALKMCSELSEYILTPEIAKTIYTIADTICRLWAESHPSIMNNTAAGDVPSLSTELYRLACKALTYCDQNLLCDCLELCKLLRLTDAVYHQCESGDYGISVQSLSGTETKRDPYQEWTFTDFFQENTLVLTSSYALPTTCKFVASCLPDTKPDALPLQHARMAGRAAFDMQDMENPVNSADCLARLSSAALELIQYLQENNQYEMAFLVLAETLGTSLQYTAANTIGIPDHKELQALIAKEQERCSQMVKIGLQRMRDFTGTLMDKIFGSRRVDHHLALSLACVLPKQGALEKLKSLTVSAGHHYRKVLAVAKVGCELGRLHNEPAVEQRCRKLETDATWGHQLGKLKISFKDVFNAQDTQDKRMLLPDIVKHPAVDMDMIKKYCSAFGLDKDEALLLYIENLLLPQAGAGDAPPDTEARILSVIREVANKELLVARLTAILDKVDSYDYLRLNFVLKCIRDENPKDPSADVGVQLMEYLVHYTRVTEPSEYEITFNCTSDEEQLRSTSVPLSPLSKDRLPYHPLMKGGQWKILARELNEETVHQLLPVARLLKLPTDHLFVTTINNLMKRAGADDTSPDRPSGTVGDRGGSRMDRKSLEVVQKLLLSISSPEMAVATARVVVKELPMGPLKVMALEICVLLARLWKEKCPDNSPEKQKAELTHQKLSHFCRCLATEQVLHRHQLAEPELLQLVDQPAKLTCKLYEHQSIERRILDLDQGGQPDIHAAANAIAEVNNCNIQKIRLHLIEQWLPNTSSNKQAEEDTTVDLSSLSFMTPKEEKVAEEERSLARVKYLLQYGGEVRGSALFLLNFAYKQASTKISNACRVRALRCLFSLLNTSMIEVVADRPVDEIREFMQNLMYLVEFEALNTSMDLGVFTTSNKQGLVRGLWKHYNHEPRAVRLIADLCLDYSVHDGKLWNSVLQQLLKFGMVCSTFQYNQMVAMLFQSVEYHAKWIISIYPLEFPPVCPPLTEEQEEACRQTAVLLQRCPIVHDLDMMEPCRQFVKVEMYAFAMGCLMYINDKPKRDKQIEALLGGKRYIAILDEITAMQKEKKLLTTAEQIKNCIFHYIEQTASYEALLTTPHFPELVNYLVNEDQIQGLLRKCLLAKRYDDAVSLIRVYYSNNPGSPSALVSDSGTPNDVLQLKAYMDHHGLSDLTSTLPLPQCNGDAARLSSTPSV